jgi:hypothetical protein
VEDLHLSLNASAHDVLKKANYSSGPISVPKQAALPMSIIVGVGDSKDVEEGQPLKLQTFVKNVQKYVWEFNSKVTQILFI